MPEAPQAGQATFNFKAAITQMVQRNASDLLLKVGRPATIRVNGELVALDSSSPLKPEELKSLAEQRSEEHTSELQSLAYLVCRLLLEKKKTHERITKTRLRYERIHARRRT